MWSRVLRHAERPLFFAGVKKAARAASTATSSLSSTGDALNGTGFKSADPFASYSRWAPTYDDDSFEILKFDSPYACRDHMLAYWPVPAAEERVKVLDVGCGTGAIGRLVAEAIGPSAVDFHGIDLTPEMLRVAKQTGYYETLREWSASRTPWPVDDDSKDMASCNGVLVYVPPDLAVLAEFVRVVKPWGHAVLMLRDDNIDDWRPHIETLELQRRWKLVRVSKTRNNFPGASDKPPIFYKMYVFQILGTRLAAAA
ncbi:hypothetical protein CTAYLR_010270 [Chrysophaeum taylorii]|uniref:Methyltransferase domain-containing protein n=1 Tax=Chrysophaeum taylorii TaxID=2483200 RepID=A0AAD7XGX5_9STRA|nr:hypothetical protein CTAYLR_010270 [Chrysophaeum taylorii]